jgi:hypothetical protein
MSLILRSLAGMPPDVLAATTNCSDGARNSDGSLACFRGHGKARLAFSC